MGLAASQARFLCITARKADCEYKSTELAQQKLEITNQLSTISNEYANAMNATKLVWSNDAVDRDYGLTYSLMMTPSAINDYNPYMLTSSSGAIILNSEYANAARAAGISKAGGAGSQASRDKFIQALVPGGIVTQETADNITSNDYRISINNNEIDIVEGTESNGAIMWNPAAGMGADPLNKSIVDAMNLVDLATSENIGQQLVDWGQLFVGEGQITTIEYNRNLENLQDLYKDAVNKKISNEIISQLQNDKEAFKASLTNPNSPAAEDQKKLDEFDKLISNAKTILAGKVSDDGYLLDSSGNKTSTTLDDAYNAIADQLKNDVTDYKKKYTDPDGNPTSNQVGIDKNKFNIKDNSLNTATYSMVQNGSINHYSSEIEELTIGDILTSNIVLMANSKISMTDFQDDVKKLFDSIVEVLGYSTTKNLSGTGLNIDDASRNALEFAYKMTLPLLQNDKCQIGSRKSDKSMTDNSAYMNAEKYNGIVSNDDKGTGYKGVSLTNLLATFLTYYDNGLNGVNSNYVIGTTIDTSDYVTDDYGYYYMAQNDSDAVVSMVARSADFFDQLYNNICEHGWREDAQVDDYEYLESAIKDGRYSMSSLNQDGYFYQTRYNETGYIIEESDTDAIARAEAEFTSKKAELTYKEDSIDIKTKQLDAEISSLSTEYDTVKQLISNSISKTFALFQN